MSKSRLLCVLLSAVLAHACTTVSQPARPRAASNTDAAKANLNVGVTYVREGRPDLAVDALNRALQLDPRLADAHYTIAIAYDQLGRFELAEEHYQRAAQIEPDNSLSANGYAVFLCRQGRWNEARKYYDRVISDKRYPTPATVLANAGVCARDAGDRESAEQYFRNALTLNNSSPDALTALMEMAYEDGNYLRARAFMQRYLDSQAAHPAVLWMCVQIENQLNNSAEADACAARLTDLFPTSPEAARLQQVSDARVR
jgi:type IV pilus assembly protein PilF